MRARLGLALAICVLAAISSAAAADPPETVLHGRLEVVHGDDFASHRGSASEPANALPDLHYLLDTGSRRYELDLAGDPPAATTGDEVTVSGRVSGDHVHGAQVQAAGGKGGGAGGGGGGKPKPPPPSYLGARDLLALVLTLDGASPPPPEQVRLAGFTGATSVQGYLTEASFGLTSIKGKADGTTSDPDGATGDVLGVTVTSTRTGCDYNGWASSARTAATALGWDLSGYEHITYVLPYRADCGEWSGLGQLGGTYTWLNGTADVGVWSHELGHNMTLYHSRTLECSRDGSRVSVAASCAYDEYGDPFDTMGDARANHHYNGRNKGHLTWVGPANVVTPVSGQPVTIKPLEAATTDPQVISIARSSSSSLYVELRATSTYDAFAPGDDVVNGVLIHTGPALATNGNSYLVDTSPYTADFTDAALGVGEGFVDPVSGTYIELQSLSSGSATVLVKTGYAASAPQATSLAGGNAVVGVPQAHPGGSAIDADKDLSSYAWSLTSCPGTCPDITSNKAGQLTKGSATVPGPVYTPTAPGTYVLTLTVRDGTGAVGTATSTDTALGLPSP